MAGDRSPVVSEDQRAVTRAELRLVELTLANRLESVEREMEQKASTAAVEYGTKLLQIEIKHIVEKQDELASFMKKGVGAILLAVLGAVLAMVLR